MYRGVGGGGGGMNSFSDGNEFVFDPSTDILYYNDDDDDDDDKDESGNK